MNLGQIRQRLYTRFKVGANPEPEVVVKFDGHINAVYRQILSEKGCQKMRRRTLTFASVSGQQSAVMPYTCSKIITIMDRTNMQPLEEISLQDLRFQDPGNIQTSSFPDQYVIKNYAAALAIDPSNASELFVKSTDANDTGVTAYLDAILTGGYPKPLSMQLNGTTAVSFSPTVTTIIGGRKFYLSSRARGDVIVTEDSGAGTELARIPQGRTFSKYTRILLVPTPAAAVTYYADVELALDDLVNEMDEPLMDEDFHECIVAGAMVQELTDREKYSAAAIEQARFKSIKGDMKVKLAQESGTARQRVISGLPPRSTRTVQ